jgi:LysM repeat protein
MGIVFDNSILMKQTRHFTLIRLLLLSSFYVVAQTPESFTTHKVRKGETLELIIEHYGIDELQLKEYNPSVERFGIRRRMNLRIPVYSIQEKAVETQSQETTIYTLNFIQHEVTPKETKWRLAYQYKTTIEILDSLNPEIREGLKIGQKIRIPQASWSYCSAKWLLGLNKIILEAM